MKKPFVYLVCICIMSLVGCGDDPVPTVPDEQKAIILTVKDDKGSIIDSAYFYYSCITNGMNSCNLGEHLMPLRVDTLTSTQVFPQPSATECKVIFSVPEEDNYSISLLDYQKRMITVHLSARLEQGNYTIEVPSYDGDKRLPSGVYYVEIKNSRKTSYTKIVFETFTEFP